MYYFYDDDCSISVSVDIHSIKPDVIRDSTIMFCAYKCLSSRYTCVSTRNRLFVVRILCDNPTKRILVHFLMSQLLYFTFLRYIFFMIFQVLQSYHH